MLMAPIAFPATVLAACVLNDYSIRAEYDRSLAVVTGRVLAERRVDISGRHYDGVMYTVQVEEVYRGNNRQLLELFSENTSGRFPMQLKELYLLFISRDVDRLAVDNCGNSGPVSQRAEVLRAVKSLVTPKRGGQKPNEPLERPGANSQADVTPLSAGRSAPGR